MASSDALKFAIGSLVTAVVVLLIFYFLDHTGHAALSAVPYV
jgi:hypothetical protein